MKVVRFLIVNLALIFVFTVLAFAQTETPQNPAPNKIAQINTDAFYDKETGIKELVETNNRFENELKPQIESLKTLAEKIQKLQKELAEYQIQIKKFPQGCYMSFESKFDEFDELTLEYKQKQEETKTLYEKRKPEIFADVYEKVGDAIKQFSKEKGFLMIIDISKDSSFIITDVDDNDVTKEFIKYYNEIFAKSKSQ